MQTLKTQHGTYTLSPTRDVGELMATFAKCAGKYKPAKIKADYRRFPLFYPGQTSTAEYVARYEQLNGDRYDRARMSAVGYPVAAGFFAPLNEEPCTLYSGEDTHETISECEVIDFPQPELMAA